jgi:hypothetical protein
MTKDHALSRLRCKIKAEEQRTRQNAVRVRISISVGLDLAGMQAADWHDACNGWTEMDQCEKFAGDFMKKGAAAAQGLRLSPVGPVLEVSTAGDAPDVEITEGISFSRPN